MTYGSNRGLTGDERYGLLWVLPSSPTGTPSRSGVRTLEHLVPLWVGDRVTGVTELINQWVKVRGRGHFPGRGTRPSFSDGTDLGEQWSPGRSQRGRPL